MSSKYTRDRYLLAGSLKIEDLEKDEVKLFFYNDAQPAWSDVASEFFSSFMGKYLKCPQEKCNSPMADNKFVSYDKGPIKSCRCYNPGDGTLTMHVDIRTEDKDWKKFLREFKSKLVTVKT